MSDQEAQHMRDAITRDQVACRCGHLLAACADCRDWLSENALRISNDWRWLLRVWGGRARYLPISADSAEADDLAYFESRR